MGVTIQLKYFDKEAARGDDIYVALLNLVPVTSFALRTSIQGTAKHRVRRALWETHLLEHSTYERKKQGNIAVCVGSLTRREFTQKWQHKHDLSAQLRASDVRKLLA